MVKCGFDLSQDFVIIWLHLRVQPPPAAPDGVDNDDGDDDDADDNDDNYDGDDNDADDIYDDGDEDDGDDGIDANADAFDISAVRSRKPCGGKS